MSFLHFGGPKLCTRNGTGDDGQKVCVVLCDVVLCGIVLSGVMWCGVLRSENR